MGGCGELECFYFIYTRKERDSKRGSGRAALLLSAQKVRTKFAFVVVFCEGLGFC